MTPSEYTVFGFAKPDGGANPGRVDHWRVLQWLRTLYLTIPTVQLSYFNATPSYRPSTGLDWTQNDIKNDEEFRRLGNADENGNTDGYEWAGGAQWTLVDCPPHMNETMFGAASTESGWLRATVPGNDDNVPLLGNGQLDFSGQDYGLRGGVVLDVRPPGSLPDGMLQADGSWDRMNASYWIRADMRLLLEAYSALGSGWYGQVINADEPFDSRIENALDTARKTSYRDGETDKTPFYLLGDPLDPDLGLVDPAWVERRTPADDGIDYVRLAR